MRVGNETWGMGATNNEYEKVELEKKDEKTIEGVLGLV